MKKNSSQAQDIEDGIEVLCDISKTGRARPWRDKRMSNEALIEPYSEVDTRKAERLKECAKVLTFAADDNGRKRLVHANFCRVRLCPMCAWRREKKIYSNVSQITEEMKKENVWAYIMLTLTVRNCEGEELSKTEDEMMDGWQRLMQSKDVKTAVKGWYRGLEVTHNVDRASESYNTYHPHFHALLAVGPRYFKDEYIGYEKWVELWRRSMRLDYDPNIDVRRVKGDTAKAIAEISKYTVKEEDYILPSDWELTVETIRILDKALHKRRLVAYGGIMKELHKRLNLEDEIDGDLVNTGEDGDVEEKRLETYAWHTGYKQYVRVKDNGATKPESKEE